MAERRMLKTYRPRLLRDTRELANQTESAWKMFKSDCER
jgi:hypothetical protein